MSDDRTRNHVEGENKEDLEQSGGDGAGVSQSDALRGRELCQRAVLALSALPFPFLLRAGGLAHCNLRSLEKGKRTVVVAELSAVVLRVDTQAVAQACSQPCGRGMRFVSQRLALYAQALLA